MAKKDQAPTMSASDFNLEKLNTKELADHIGATISLGGNIGIFGRRGIGKTLIAKQQIKQAGKKEVYLNLSVLERVDMGGYPNIMAAAQQKKFVDFLLPQFMQPMIEGKGVVALLDEVDKADPSLWAPLLEFTQFHSINGNKLPGLEAVIMTGNLISEGGQRPSLPLLDRAEKYLIETDTQAWMQWAGRDGHIHPSIVAYINDNPNDLCGDVDPQDRYSDTSPRGWHRASDILKAGEEKGWSYDLLNKKVSGCIGKMVGLKYSHYFTYYQELLPMVDAIYAGKNKIKDYDALEPTKKLVACMIICTRLATHMDQHTLENPPPALTHIGKFMTNVAYENILVGVRTQIQVARMVKYALDKNDHWGPVLKQISNAVEGN